MVVFMKRRQLAAAALGVLAALTLLFVIPGCQRDSGGTEPVQAADNAARVAYLESLGWQVTPEPLETLSLLLPEDLSAHAEYAALQKHAQGAETQVTFIKQEMCTTVGLNR